ncbi:MAG: metallophosphoesterase [Bacteroidales bacterium]|nr:metallophosphoesterase [Bacteroidales bacterium]
MAFFIFFTIVLGIYALGNYYVFIRGLQAIPPESMLRKHYIVWFWVLAGTYIAGRVLENIHLSYLSDVLVWTGSFWLGALLYFFLLVLLFDLIRLSNALLPWLPGFVTGNMAKVRFYAFAGSVAVVFLLMVAGFINARSPVVRHLELHINKPAGPLSEVNAVLISDIHLGTIIGNGYFSRLVDKAMALEPDIILLAGDILDEDLAPVIRQDIGKTLHQLRAPLGVFAVMGNHEHIGGHNAAQEYLERHGLQILRDTAVMVNESFWLAGRDDRDKQRFTGRSRKPLEEVLHEVDFSYPVLLMDHQPFYLEKAAALGVDLQVSGHTHHGQMWPLNYITRAMYTISHGYGNINGMHAYISNGTGTWGPPVRIGNRPEIVHLRLKFKQP